MHPGLELTWIGRAPARSTGIRLGLGQLDREVTDGMSGETPMDHTTVTRLLPEVSGVLRLDPFQGDSAPSSRRTRAGSHGPGRADVGCGQQPDGLSEPAYDATAHYGWAAGVQVQLGEGAFLTARYGSRFGGALDLHESDVNPTVMPDPLDGERPRGAGIQLRPLTHSGRPHGLHRVHSGGQGRRLPPLTQRCRAQRKRSTPKTRRNPPMSH